MALAIVSACALLPNVAWVSNSADVEVPDETRLTAPDVNGLIGQWLGHVPLDIPLAAQYLVEPGTCTLCAERVFTASSVEKAIRVGAPRAPPAARSSRTT